MKTESGLPFDSFTNIASTADEQSYNDLKDVYNSIDGLNSDYLNLDSIPIEADFIYSADITQIPRSAITHLFRVVNNAADKEQNEPLLKLYQNRTQTLYVFRAPVDAEDPDSIQPRSPISVDLRKERIFPLCAEATLFNRILFQDIVNQVKIEFILRRRLKLVSETRFVQKSGVVQSDAGVDEGVYIFDHGLKCIEDGTDCIFDNRDTTYSWDAESYKLEDDDIYIIVGLNHNLYGMTRYNSFGIYYITDPLNPDLPFTPLTEPVQGSIIDDEYEQFKIQDVIGRSIATRFTNSFIASVSKPNNCLNKEMASLCPPESQLSAQESFVYLARAHLNPQTATAPNAKQLIPWRLLRFKTRN